MSEPDAQYFELLAQAAALDPDADASAIFEAMHSRYLELVRGGTTPTPNGYPYPDPTDPIAEGADAIRALAEALNNRTMMTLAQDALTAKVLPTSWPEGISSMAISGTTALANGWPRDATMVVWTFRRLTSSGTFQLVARGAEDKPWLYYRNGNLNGWAPWRNAAGPYGVAAGTVTHPSTPANSSSTVTVTLPSGTFSEAPLVTMNTRTAVPAERVCAAGSVTASSFVSTFGNATTSAIGTNADWHAIQMDRIIAVSAARAAALADAVPPVEVSVTCPTPGCPNEGIPVLAISEFPDDEGNLIPVGSIMCGECGATLTPDPAPDPEPEPK